MVEISRFNGRDAYTASEFAEVFSSAHMDGVDVAQSPNALEVKKADGLVIRVEPGTAWLRGTWYRTTEPITMQVADLPDQKGGKIVCRYDRVVLHATREVGADGGWTVKALLKTGDPASADTIPTTPSYFPTGSSALARSAEVWETPLATILIARNPNQKDEIVAVWDERDHIVTASFVLGFSTPGGITTTSTAEVVVPFGIVPSEWSVIADAPITNYLIVISYRMWDGFSTGAPSSETTIDVISSNKLTTGAAAIAARISKPTLIPRHAILQVALTPQQPTLAPPQNQPRIPTRVTVQIGAIRADVSR